MNLNATFIPIVLENEDAGGIFQSREDVALRSMLTVGESKQQL